MILRKLPLLDAKELSKFMEEVVFYSQGWVKCPADVQILSVDKVSDL